MHGNSYPANAELKVKVTMILESKRIPKASLEVAHRTDLMSSKIMNCEQQHAFIFAYFIYLHISPSNTKPTPMHWILLVTFVTDKHFDEKFTNVYLREKNRIFPSL